jgi:hypothetical protein
VAAAALVAVLVSGCGGDSEAATLTKAEYVKQADAICAERKKEWTSDLASYKKKVKEENASSDPDKQAELAEDVLDESLLPALQKQLESLEELGPPAGKEKQVDKMLKSLSNGIENIEKGGLKALVSEGFEDFAGEAKALGVNCPL